MDRVLECFRACDSKGDGTIPASQLRRLLLRLCQDFKSDDIDALLCQAYGPKGAKQEAVQYQTFLHYLAGTAPPPAAPAAKATTLSPGSPSKKKRFSDALRTGLKNGEVAQIVDKMEEDAAQAGDGRTAFTTRAGAAGMIDGVPIDDTHTGGVAFYIIDPQVDFHEGGSLAVAGATEDSARIAQLLRKHGDAIERVVVTLDTHHVMHIHNNKFWEGKDGNHPDPFTIISAADIKAGTWIARQPEMRAWSLQYAERLEAGERFQLMIWPQHCTLGSPGHAIHPPLMEALGEWADRRARSVNWYFKGQNNRTEMYSALKAEVEIEDDKTTSLDLELIATLSQHRQVVCCGEALSHCLNYSTRDLLSGWPKERAQDIVVLEDCASAVAGFESPAAAFLDDMRSAGVTVCKAEEFAPASGDLGLVMPPMLCKSASSSMTARFAPELTGCGQRAGAAGSMDGFSPEDSYSGGVCLFLIDPQNDFHEGGSLAVPGATQDSKRIAELLRAHGQAIERVVVALDTHHSMHIHFGKFWEGRDGKRPEPYTVITKEDIKAGTWQARQPEMKTWALAYAEKLEAGGRFSLVIWPEHCILGKQGHAVHAPLMEALNEWSVSRRRSVNWRFHGQNNRTEMYSCLKAEVELDDDRTTHLDKDLISTLARHSKVVCCGEALSHCLNFSVRDLLGEWPAGRASDIVLLEDASSPVTGFEDAASAFVSDMRSAGVSVCKAAEFKP